MKRKWVAIHIKKEGHSMKNEMIQKPKNEVALTGGQKLQAQLIQELEAVSAEIGKGFTEYGKTCLINAIAGLVIFTKNNGIKIEDLDPTLLRLQLQNVGYTELNYSSIPSEIYFDIRKGTRKVKDADGKEREINAYSLTIKPQGAGNEKLVRKYGVGLKKDIGLRPAWLIREGDKFVMPQFNGIEVTPPKYEPEFKNANNKIVAVVYPAIKIDGSVEYLIATRESVKANIVAQIRQNTLYSFYKKDANGYYAKDKYGNKVVDTEARDKFYDELNKFADSHTVDELLAEPKYVDCVNPTYTSGGSKEQMILRKMKNNALKNYPKEYDNSYIAESVRNMFEEQDESLNEKPFVNPSKDIVESVQEEIDEPQSEDAVPSFEINEDGEVIRHNHVEEKPEEVSQKPTEEPKVEEKAEESQEQPQSTNYDDLI